MTLIISATEIQIAREYFNFVWITLKLSIDENHNPNEIQME